MMEVDHHDLMAIDVLLVPDRKTIDRSISINAKLRADYPACYRLDGRRIPHLTLLQRFVPAKKLEAVCAAVRKVADNEPLTALTLTAGRIDSVSFEGLAVAVIVGERTPGLARLHQEVADAVAPFSADGGSSAAFADQTVAAGTVDWVETFVPKSSGENYQPHITAGIATGPFVAELEAAPFLPFVFKADALAVFQIGNFGTAARKLWQS